MTPRRSIVGNLAESRWFRQAWRRRLIALVLILVLALLALFPHTYRAATTMTPTDPSSLGLGGALGELGALNTVFGNQAAIEISLKVARSQNVRDMVSQRLKLVSSGRFGDRIAADRWLRRNVDIRVLRGGLIQIDSKRSSADEARQLVTAFALATRESLAEINRVQTAYKRSILVNLVTRASNRYARAQYAYDTFRKNTRYTSPQSTITALGARVPALEIEIKQLDAEIAATSRFATGENLVVRQLQAHKAALQQQLAQARNVAGDDPFSVNEVVARQKRLEVLDRERSVAYNLYISYRRFLEGTAVEDLTAMASIRMLELPYIDTARQINMAPAALCVFVILLAAAIELYLLRPPLGHARDTA